MTHPKDEVLFVKVLSAGDDMVYLRGFTEPPGLRWWTEPGVPSLQIEPAEGERTGGVRIIEVSRTELRDWGPVSLRVASGLYADELESLHRVRLDRVPVLTAELTAELLAIEPSRDRDLEYRPSRVRMLDGSVVDRVQLVEASSYIRFWGMWPTDDPDKESVRLSDVSHIEEFPMRIPPQFASKMYAAGESAMGGCFFVLLLRDGRRLPCATGNVVDFVKFPAGVDPTDIVDLIPHDRGQPGDLPPSEAWSGRQYSWCLSRSAAK